MISEEISKSAVTEYNESVIVAKFRVPAGVFTDTKTFDGTEDFTIPSMVSCWLLVVKSWFEGSRTFGRVIDKVRANDVD